MHHVAPSSDSALLRAWLSVRALLRVLWACRVSLCAVLLPAGIFWYSAAARDLFWHFSGNLAEGGNDLKPNIGAGEARTVGFWTAFTALALLLWAYPVHFSARIILNYPEWLFGSRREVDDDELLRARERYRSFIIWVPRLLGTATFVVLGFATLAAIWDIPDPAIYETVGMGKAGSEEMRTLLRVLVGWFFFVAAFVFVWLSFLRRKGVRGARAAPARRIPPGRSPAARFSSATARRSATGRRSRRTCSRAMSPSGSSRPCCSRPCSGRTGS